MRSPFKAAPISMHEGVLMNRRKALLGLSAGTLAVTGSTFAQQGNGRGPVGTNLRALILSRDAVNRRSSLSTRLLGSGGVSPRL
jgi:hypothetical protein